MEWEKARTAAFLESLLPMEDAVLRRLRREAEGAGIPIVRRETESFLTFLAAMRKPVRILEIGTASGYSAIAMAKACEGTVTGMENDHVRLKMAEKNIAEAGLADRIQVLEGDAGGLLEKLAEQGGTYDLIFLDAAKAQYVNWLPVILKLMDKGSLLAADNVLCAGIVAESRFTVERRDRTIHERMRAFLKAVSRSEELKTSVLPLGDGVSVSVKL